MRTSRALAVVGALVLAIPGLLGLAGCFAGDEASLTIANRSDLAIEAIRFAVSGAEGLGPNRLSAPLRRDQVFVIGDLGCDLYEVEVVDEHGAACELTALDICHEDVAWVLDGDLDASCGRLERP